MGGGEELEKEKQGVDPEASADLSQNRFDQVKQGDTTLHDEIEINIHLRKDTKDRPQKTPA